MSKRNTRPVIKNDPATYRTRSTLVSNSSTRMADEGRIMVAFGFDRIPDACSHNYLQLSDLTPLAEPYYVETGHRCIEPGPGD